MAVRCHESAHIIVIFLKYNVKVLLNDEQRLSYHCDFEICAIVVKILVILHDIVFAKL